MSIPLDRLYHFIESVAQDILQDRVIIYRFYPHGSKNFLDLAPLNPAVWREWTVSPQVYCNDQEPLDYDYYENSENTPFAPPFSKIGNLQRFRSYYDHAIIIHSEKRSQNVEKYSCNHFIPVYYWSHAVIALDWFRYARHVKLKKQYKKTFLVYNRAWSGTREYRLCFTELLVKHNLQDFCQTSFNPIEPELRIHYNQHEFKNTEWRPQTVLEDYFPTNGTPSHYSADFTINDYNDTDIEVVLETLFDDDRIHLTEKSLRPITLAQPFILASTAGSLEYLRSYGFQTFDTVWDETYDTIVAPGDRLRAIVKLMSDLASWDPITKHNKMQQAQAIAKFNQQHFFSKEFFNLVKKELTDNLTTAFDSITTNNTYKRWLNAWDQNLNNPKIVECLIQKNPANFPTLQDIKSVQDLINRKLNSK